ncbi:MAG: hemolysin family protein [Candidatus Dormibacteraceae bacterium]
MNTEAWSEILLLLICVVISALASAAETAITSVGHFKAQHLAEAGNPSARMLERLHQDPNRFLSTVLVVNTVALILASFATTLLSVHFLPAGYGFAADLGISLLLTVFLLIFAEVTPKTVAIRHSERIALLAARPVDLLSRALRPVLWLITLVARGVTGGGAAPSLYLSEEELMSMLHVSEIEQEEREMIHGIIEIGDMAVREVMVPRTDITAVDKTSRLEEILDLFRQTRHTRIPVYDQDLDNIVGLVHAKDLTLLLAHDPRPPFQIERLMRPIEFTPESKKVDELIHQMQAQRVHMMVVLDEYGGTAGLVTLEDLLEEIVGEIRDEYDGSEEEQLKILGPCLAQVDALLPMDELNERLALGLEESEDYDSVGGYVLATLGRFPKPGTTFKTGAVQWTVETAENYRIHQVRLESDLPWPAAVLAEAGLPPSSSSPSSS